MGTDFDPPSSAGITFVFASQTYTATSISVSRGVMQEIDCTSTDIPIDGLKRYRTGDVEMCDIKVDWIGLVVPTVTTTATFSISGGAYTSLGSTGTIALCSGLSLSAGAGDLIKGSATFKVSKF